MLIGEVWISPPMVTEISELIGVHQATVRRWLREKRIPRAHYQLLDLLLNGSLARIAPCWDQWKVHAKSGELVTPAGDCVTPGEIIAMRYRYHQLASLQRENDSLRKERDQAAAISGGRYARSIG